MKIDSLEELQEKAAPSGLFVGDAVLPNCWDRASRMLALWHEMRGEAAAPHRSAFSPMNIGEDMALMAFFDVEREPFRLKCRLMGSAFSTAIGYDGTGTYVDERPGTQPLIERAAWVIHHVTPLLIKDLQLVWSPERSYKSYSSLGMPFLGDSGTVDSVVYLNQFRST